MYLSINAVIQVCLGCLLMINASQKNVLRTSLSINSPTTVESIDSNVEVSIVEKHCKECNNLITKEEKSTIVTANGILYHERCYFRPTDQLNNKWHPSQIDEETDILPNLGQENSSITTCAICLDPIADIFVTLPCNDKYCLQCIDRDWMERKVCPQCKEEYHLSILDIYQSQMVHNGLTLLRISLEEKGSQFISFLNHVYGESQSIKKFNIFDGLSKNIVEIRQILTSEDGDDWMEITGTLVKTLYQQLSRSELIELVQLGIYAIWGSHEYNFAFRIFENNLLNSLTMDKIKPVQKASEETFTYIKDIVSSSEINFEAFAEKRIVPLHYLLTNDEKTDLKDLNERLSELNPMYFSKKRLDEMDDLLDNIARIPNKFKNLLKENYSENKNRKAETSTV